jgi:photosystem II stability/assembly factor-like uncharacterized protein
MRNEGLYVRAMHTVSADPRRESVVFASAPGAVYKSTNGGNFWNERNIGLVKSSTSSVAANGFFVLTTASIPGLGGKYGGITRSLNAGLTWTIVDQEAEGIFTRVNDATIIPGSPNISLAGGRFGQWGHEDPNMRAVILRSTSDGNDWSPVLFDLNYPAYTRARSVSTLAVDSRNLDYLYAGMTPNEPNPLLPPLFLFTTDRGVSWLQGGNPTTNSSASITEIVVDPTSFGGVASSVLYLGGIEIGLLKSTNRGASWNSAGFEADVYSVAINPNDSRVLIVGSTSGLFRTTDGGQNWSQVLNTPQAINSVLIHPSTPSIVYTAADGPGLIYKSIDGGATWGSFNQDLTQIVVKKLRLDVKDHNILFAATDSGVYSIPHVWMGQLVADATWKTNATYLVEGTLTVASGKTLNIEPGATVKFFPPYGELVVNGTLQAVGQEGSRITFMSYETGSEWRGISLPTARSGSRIEYADIADAVVGIAVNHNSEASITHCNITGGKIGIHLYDAPGPWPLLRTNVQNNSISQSRLVGISVDKEASNVLIQDNTLVGNFNDDVGMQFIYASPLDVLRNRVTNFGKHGVQCISASPSFIDGTEEGGRSCFVSNAIGVYGEASANFILGIAYDDGTYSGNNTITYNEEFEIVLRDKCTVYSQMNYHGDRNYDFDDSSQLITDPELGEDPNRCLDQGNRPLAITAGNQLKETDPPMLSGFARNPLVKQAVRLRLRRDHLAAIGVLKGLIAAQTTDVELVRWALHELLANYQMVPNPSGSNILAGYC